MCNHCAGIQKSHRQAFTYKEIPPEAQQAIEAFFSDLRDLLAEPREEIAGQIYSGDVDLEDIESIRASVRSTFGNYTNDFQVTFADGAERGAEAGRNLATRRFGLDLEFGRPPERVLEELREWSFEASDEVVDRMVGDISEFLRSTQREGLSIPDAADRLQEEYFDNRLRQFEARRIARTETIGSSNAGADSAYQEADSVVGKEWLATSDGRTRDTHLSADGQTTGPSGSFSVGGYEARYPGDPQLPVEERVNCRCTTVPRFE